MDIQASGGSSHAGYLAHSGTGSSFAYLCSPCGQKEVLNEKIAGERGDSLVCNEAAVEAAVRLYSLTIPMSEEVSNTGQELASYSTDSQISSEVLGISLDSRDSRKEDLTRRTPPTSQAKEPYTSSIKSGLTIKQMQVLQTAFRLQPYCSRQQRCQLADVVDTDEATVTRWFKNARRRVKRLYSRQWDCDNSAFLCKFTPESLVQPVSEFGNTINITS